MNPNINSKFMRLHFHRRQKMNLILEKHSNHKFSEYFLCMDAGGTATLIGLVGIKDKEPYLAYSTSIWTKEIPSFENFVKQVKDYVSETLKIKVEKIGIAAAGPKEKDVITITHQKKKKIDIKKIKKKGDFKKAILLNDFDALGYSINLMDSAKKTKNNIALIGAGTGLGKAVLKHNGKYFEPLAGEGGHAEFPIRSAEELELKKFITRNKRDLQCEDLVSGKGIENIYDFLRFNKKIPKSEFSDRIDKSKNKIFLITEYKDKDNTCNEAFKMFTRYYARTVKNYALEVTAQGGIYLAGGITTRNPEIISKEFFSELSKLDGGQKVLKGIDVNIIPQKEASLLGLAFAITHKP